MRILVISVHPDDETLGCGGTILKHNANGDDIFWLVATQAYEPQWPVEIIERKADEVKRVASIYGVKQVFKLGFPTVKLDTISQAEIMDRVRDVITEVKPELVYLVHDGDVHSDHHAVFQATLCVLKAFYMRGMGVRSILSYETLSSTEAAPPHFSRAFIPNVYHDITAYVDRKIEIMGMFATETQRDPYPRGQSAIRALARYRGATIGVDYAEAFVLIRQVD